jgi:hypothetical protein
MRPVVRNAPAIAGWLLGGLVAIGLAGSVYVIPVQVSEALEAIVRVVPLPSAWSAFTNGLQDSATLRPLKLVRAKILVSTSRALDGRYHLVFRGYEALAATALIGLFVWVARVRIWTDVAALGFALTVLTGLQTFPSMFREGYPVNHFLVVAVYALLLFAIARSRGGALADAVALAIVTVSCLTIESGLLLLPIAVAGYAAGLRGISRRGIVALASLFVCYLVLRFGVLDIEGAGLGERDTGFGAGFLSSDEQVARFGDNPLPLYAYNILSAALSVILSQPVIGQWSVIDAWRNDAVTPVFWVEIGSSAVTTLAMVVYVLGRREDGGRRWREPIPFVAIVLLLSNAAISYPYGKDEIISISGVFYALLAFIVVRHLLTRQTSPRRAAALAVGLVLVSGAWGIRAASSHYSLRRAAFDARNQWAGIPADGGPASMDAEVRAVVAGIRREVVQQRSIAPAFPSRTMDEWLGED